MLKPTMNGYEITTGESFCVVPSVPVYSKNTVIDSEGKSAGAFITLSGKKFLLSTTTTFLRGAVFPITFKLETEHLVSPLYSL